MCRGASWASLAEDDADATFTHLDGETARILESLERSGRLHDTLVILAGGNGLALGNQGHMGEQSCYRHRVRVPLVLRRPGIARGERRDSCRGAART